MSPSERKALDLLRERGYLTTRAMQDAFGIGRKYAEELASRLWQGGLVERHHCESGGRVGRPPYRYYLKGE